MSAKDEPAIQPRTLAYEQLPRPRELTIEEDEASTVVRVPPPPVAWMVRRLVLIGLLLIFLLYMTLIGADDLSQGRAHWAHWGRVMWILIVVGQCAASLTAFVRQSRSWTTIEASPAGLSVSLYDHRVWSHIQWPRDEIASISAMRGALQWNLRRPRYLRIALSDGHHDLLHRLPMVDLERMADVLRRQLGMS